ncbi:MAG: hypothetical protein KDA61_15820 [Planctomycetales bacterium]|nr:hypothetical protein [Planctomycetales bacterium]
MTYLIGVDEAGYGPNLGPLTIAASTWRVADGADCDLYEALSQSVSRVPTHDTVAIADSKALYKPGGGLRTLECGVLGALSQRTSAPATRDSLLAQLKADAIPRTPWNSVDDWPLPIDASPDEISAAGDRLGHGLAAGGVQLVDLRARLVFPDEFNALVERHGTKGAALSHCTLALVRQAVDAADAGTECVDVVCDKHGGRNRYAGLIQHHFAESWVTPITEGRAESRYRCDGPHAGVSLAFRTGGESHLPAALASMTAKYLREVFMREFNAYWAAQVPGIRPTAGYPVDAKRFKAEIDSAQRKLGIADAVLWRNK